MKSGHVSLRIALLDKQLVDSDDLPFGRVDDVEIALSGAGKRPLVSALLTGAEPLGQRLGGTLGGWMAATAARFRPPSMADGPVRIQPALVRDLEPIVVLRVPLRDLSDVAGLERWLARHVVEPLPGAGDARE